MPAPLFHRLLTYLIALVWLANGLLCKVLNLVPRHAAIVARILGPAYSGPLTRLIGLAEIGMAIWLLSGLRRRWCVVAQMGLVVAMNALEFLLAPDLLLWGRVNALFAGLFVGLLYYYEFLLPRPTAR
ncbi:MAG TPA: DoxX-like family protein [Hymenobacter sp.]|uniref:DoxX-like family protein n=1 Tax=Hymenobacter sp. TaxID=1898978 RepID=UPI002D80E464|nr:DoxX-like family protein [Hymenobacter sp.]HET9505737.1 DoxX-like family protein [Hymenobacter sp.]